MDDTQDRQALTPLQDQQSLGDGAYLTIRQAVLEGRLRPGTRLSVPQLASQLGVSRSPVREAILRLEREGLATSYPNRGAEVAAPDWNDLRNLYDVREVLEGLVARQAAERADDEDRVRLEALWEEHKRAVAAGDIDQHMDRDLAFHTKLRVTARNDCAAAALERLSGQILLALHATAAMPGNPEQAIVEHREVLDAVLAGDPENAEQAARAHVLRVKESLPPEGEVKSRESHFG